MPKGKIPKKWVGEKSAIKAIQVAFDLDEKIQYLIRREALDLDINPSERIRHILDLPTNKTVQRPRLSVSLKPDDFEFLGKKYGVDAADQKTIKQKAFLELQEYAKGKK